MWSKMKIILSRKGFDSSNGGCPNPILPNGTLLSLPIPSEDELSFSDIQYGGQSYADILGKIHPKGIYDKCHLDPDIREGVRKNVPLNWQPAFGQIGAAQGILRNSGVETGDIFLFFGRFRQTEIDSSGILQYKKGEPILHIIFGYLQIGKILTDPKDITEYSYHPHASKELLKNKTNALYLPAKNLSFLTDKKGYGILNYDEKRILTMKNKSTSTWKYKDFYMPNNIYGCKKNSAKDDGIFYKGIWQELVLNESEAANQWAKSIILCDNAQC